MRYFSHDTNASSDELILQLRMEHGGEAVDAFWVILEYIYSEEKPLVFGENQRETKSVMHRLCLGYEVLEKYVKTMVEVGLLVWKKSQGSSTKLLSNLRAEEAIEAYHVKAKNARQNGKKGGRPRNENKNPEETKGVFASVSKKNQREKLTKTKTKKVGFDKQNLPTEGSGALVDAPAPSGMDAFRAKQEQLEAQAIPCPDSIKAIFDEVDRL